MTVGDVGSETVDVRAIGEQLYGLVEELYPICRSITGDGVRETLRRIGERLPELVVHEVPTGTEVFDWTIPREWNIREAWIEGPDGKRVIDFADHNLHVMGYSVPVRARLSLDELRPHLATIPEHPDWIPYRTSYYREAWGFCLRHETMLALRDGDYEVCIDSTLADGQLTYGECYLPGETTDEVLISTHVCHPSLANDNLSGIALATYLARLVASSRRRLSYRFVFVPGTIGSIAWLAANRESVSRIAHGLVLTCAGDPGRVTYKRSRQGQATVDRAVAHVLARSGRDHELIDFSPYGYDERQYCSPAFDLPVGCFMRTPHGRYPEYHSSADGLGLVRADSLGDSFATLASVLALLDDERRYVNLNPACEPQLGRRGLYSAIGGRKDASATELAMLWVLNQSDSHHTLLDIAERSGLEFNVVKAAADLLLEHDLLREAAPPEGQRGRSA